MSEHSANTQHAMGRILGSDLLNCGDSFTSTEVIVELGLRRHTVYTALRELAREGKIAVYQVREGKHVWNRYKKKQKSLLSKSWRTLSNAEIGITESYQFGVPV